MAELDICEQHGVPLEADATRGMICPACQREIHQYAVTTDWLYLRRVRAWLTKMLAHRQLADSALTTVARQREPRS